MNTNRDTGRSRFARIASSLTTPSLASTARRLAVSALALTLVASSPVAAQSTGQAFCNTQLAQTIQNLFTLIQFGGPLIGGTVALGSTVGLIIVDQVDHIQKLKEARTRALIYGVLIAPIAGSIIAFLLNNVVAGGASCGF